MFTDCIDRLQIPESHRSLLNRVGPTPPHEGDQRRFVRHYAVSKATLECQQSLPALPRKKEKHAVMVLDLSRGGVRLFHSEQLYPGERLFLTLTKEKRMAVEIAWCQKIAPLCYQVGARFLLEGPK
jgi:hypothetical protein